MNVYMDHFVRLIVKIHFFARENKVHDEVFRLCHKACWCLQYWPCRGGKLLVLSFRPVDFQGAGEGILTSMQLFSPKCIALSLGSVSLELPGSPGMFLYDFHLFSTCFWLLPSFLLGNVQTASCFLTGRCTRNGNSSNTDPNNNSSVRPF